MKMVKSKRYVYNKRFEGMPTEDNFKIVEEDLRELKNGEFLVEAQYLSVDPYVRLGDAFGVNIGDTIHTCQVSKIIESKNPKFPSGEHIYGYLPCATSAIVTEQPQGVPLLPTFVIPDKTFPLSFYAGALGPSGNTAYFGLTEICKPKPGETVVVTAAAGSVGHLVGQMAKILGCRVIGLCGSDEKCEWLKSIGFDEALNYKSNNLEEALGIAASNGIDCYFDNVGGELSSMIMNKMNTFGRVAVCGWISSYTKKLEDIPKSTILQPTILYKQLSIEGFLAGRWAHRWMEGIHQSIIWIKEGKLKPKETIMEGFDSYYPTALVNIFNGENIGKTLIKV